MKKLPILALLSALLLLWALPAGAQAQAFSMAKVATKVSILPSRLTHNDGTSRALKAQVKNGQAASRVVWSVEGASQVVTVDENGLVTALKPGSAFVRATDAVTGAYARRKVTVRSVKVKNVILSKGSLGLKPGQVYEGLTATISPKNASIKEVVWQSSNPSVVAVDEKTGALTAVGSGTATITARAGGKKATCKVKVVGKYATFTLSAVGDVVLGGDPMPKSALNRVTKEVFADLLAKNGQDYPFKNVQSVLRGDDLTFANLECALTYHTEAKTKPHVLQGDPAYAQILKSAGIEVCNLANNHTKDFGLVGYNDTRAALKAAGVSYCDFSGDAIYTLSKNGITVKVGFAGFQTAVPEAKVISRVRSLKKRCDVVVASFHWCDTKEWVAKNFITDKAMAHRAIEAGADLVLGHHRHVPAGIDLYRGKYIVYDLSNFVVGIKHKSENGRPLTDSMIFQWTFMMDESGYLADEGIKVIPCSTTSSAETYPATDDFGNLGAPINNWQPVILSGQEGRAVIARIQAMSNIPVPMG